MTSHEMARAGVEIGTIIATYILIKVLKPYKGYPAKKSATSPGNANKVRPANTVMAHACVSQFITVIIGIIFYHLEEEAASEDGPTVVLFTVFVVAFILSSII